MVSPPPASALPPGWTITEVGEESRRYGTFRAEPPRSSASRRGGRPSPTVTKLPFVLPRAKTVSEMATLLQSEGLVHVPGALSPAHVTNLCSLFRSLVPDRNSPLDRWSGSAAHLAATAAAEAAGDEPPYVDRAIQTLFNREAGDESTPFLRYLDVDPPCAVAEAVLGKEAHVIQHNLWETPPGRPRGSTSPMLTHPGKPSVLRQGTNLQLLLCAMLSQAGHTLTMFRCRLQQRSCSLVRWKPQCLC